jgi:4-diphosphocytidyl-2-C-methyl-D-erythritol kinase
MSDTRRVRLRALAKINLDLRVLGSGPTATTSCAPSFRRSRWPTARDCFHSGAPKTVIELADELASPITWWSARRASRWMPCALTGRVEMRLTKRIPMGAGLGGGSSDAAAVLLALPVLAGRSLAI